MLDGNNKPVRVTKKVYNVSKREIHNKVLDPVEDGGFEGARDKNTGDVLMSYTSMNRHWPNDVVKATNRHKSMCCCDRCGVPKKIHNSLCVCRTSTVKRLKEEEKAMAAGEA